MPKKAKDLSALEVSRLTAPGHHAVGGVAGLYLYVLDTGAIVAEGTAAELADTPEIKAAYLGA